MVVTTDQLTTTDQQQSTILEISVPDLSKLLVGNAVGRSLSKISSPSSEGGMTDKPPQLSSFPSFDGEDSAMFGAAAPAPPAFAASPVFVRPPSNSRKAGRPNDPSSPSASPPLEQTTAPLGGAEQSKTPPLLSPAPVRVFPQSLADEMLLFSGGTSQPMQLPRGGRQCSAQNGWERRAKAGEAWERGIMDELVQLEKAIAKERAEWASSPLLFAEERDEGVGASASGGVQTEWVGGYANTLSGVSGVSGVSGDGGTTITLSGMSGVSGDGGGTTITVGPMGVESVEGQETVRATNAGAFDYTTVSGSTNTVSAMPPGTSSATSGVETASGVQTISAAGGPVSTSGAAESATMSADSATGAVSVLEKGTYSQGYTGEDGESGYQADFVDEW